MCDGSFSRTDLIDILGDEDVAAVAELRTLFEMEAGRLVVEITEAASRDRLDHVARGAHKLKSVAGNVGGRGARILAIAIEDAARLGQRSELETLMARLEPEVDALRAALGSYAAELASRPAGTR